MLKCVLVAALAAASICATTAHAAARPAVFNDPAGDSGTAADVSGVSVANTNDGQYTFDVTLLTDYPADGQFYLYLDTDKNPSTGDESGADYVVWDDFADHAADLYTWNGSDWGDTPEDTFSFEVGGDHRSLTASVNKSELGGSTAFSFFVVATNADETDGHYDDAPNGTGMWDYAFQNAVSLTATPVRTLVQKKQHAWTIAMAAVRSDTGKTVGSEGTITCRATAGSTALRMITKAFVSGGWAPAPPPSASSGCRRSTSR